MGPAQIPIRSNTRSQKRRKKPLLWWHELLLDFLTCYCYLSFLLCGLAWKFSMYEDHVWHSFALIISYCLFMLPYFLKYMPQGLLVHANLHLCFWMCEEIWAWVFCVHSSIMTSSVHDLSGIFFKVFFVWYFSSDIFC